MAPPSDGSQTVSSTSRRTLMMCRWPTWLLLAVLLYSAPVACADNAAKADNLATLDNDIVFDDDTFHQHNLDDKSKKDSDVDEDDDDLSLPLPPFEVSDKAKNANRPKRQFDQYRHADTLPTDDEDLLAFGSGDKTDGSGFIDTGRVDHLKPDYFRCNLSVQIVYEESLSRRESYEFRTNSESLTRALEHLYEGIPGQQAITILRFQPTQDPFFSLVTFDIGSRGFNNSLALQTVLEEQIKQGALENYALSSDGFAFRYVASSAIAAEGCPGDQLRCRNGQCVPLASRCDGIRNCVDGTDELGCGGRDREDGVFTLPDGENEGPPSPPHVPVPGGETREQKCRADTQLTCPDRTTVICEVQWCDGIPDCPDSADERNCPGAG